MRRAILVAFCLAAGVGPSAAAEATSEAAQGLTATFHRYLGPVRAGQSDFVRIEPQGDAYRASFDLAEFVRPLETVGIALDPAELSFLAEPLADGTWRVSELKLPSPLTAHVKDQTMTYRFEGVSFDGVYDPALAAFVRFDQTIAGMTNQVAGPNNHANARYGEQHITGTGIAAEGEIGGVDLSVRQTVGAFSMDQSISMPPAGEGSPPPSQFDMAYGAESGRGEASFAGLKATRLLDLWAYVVAHIQPDAPAIGNAEIKALLTDLLPIFQQLEENGALRALKVETPAGKFGIQDLSGSMALSGIVSSSVLRASLKLGGPSLPPELVPAWATQLVPDALEIGVNVSGLNLDASARRVIGAIDASKKPWVEEAIWADAAQLAMPAGGVKLTLGPTSIHGPVLDITADGEMTLAAAERSGSFNVTVKGLDAAIELLKAAGGDPIASQALASLLLAQSWGRQASDGTTYYGIEIDNDGAVTVNGQLLRPGSEKAL